MSGLAVAPLVADVSTYVSVVLAALLAAVGWLYRHERERRENAEASVSEHKYQAYVGLLKPFFDSMKAGVLGTDPPADLVERLFDANKNLVLYGSDEVVARYQEWLREVRAQVMDLLKFGGVIVAIRQDMGHPKTAMTADDVLRPFITDYDDAKARGELRRTMDADGS